MASKRLTLETLPKVRDGAIKHDFNSALARLYDDCLDRPKSGKARKLTLEVTLKPIVDDGVLELVETTFAVNSSIPKHTFSRRMKVSQKQQGLMFETDTDSTKHSNDQRSFDE